MTNDDNFEKLKGMAISPHFRVAHLEGASLDRKIEIFADQMRGWYLSQARVLVQNPSELGHHCGYAVLAICMVYIEAISQYIQGRTSNNRSKEAFLFGMTQVFPDLSAKDLEKFASEFYSEVRCGLIHSCRTGGKVVIVPSGEHAIAIHFGQDGNAVKKVSINPFAFLAVLEQHLEGYLTRLRFPSTEHDELRKNFATWFDGNT